MRTKKEMLRLAIFYGTRPEFLKLYAVIQRLHSHPQVELMTINTGQHKELLDPIEEEFNFTPDFKLKIMGKADNLGELYALLQEKIFDVVANGNYDLVTAQGDTATVYASALSAYLNQVPFAHLEGGMRTNDKYSPFPEEVNRRVTSHIADLHFCWTEIEKENLLKEDIPEENIFITGNTLIDTLNIAYDDNFSFSDHLPEKLLNEINLDKKVILITQHRRENMGERHLNIFQAIKEILQENKDYIGVYPVHYNPQVQKRAHQFFKNVENAYLIEPLSYKPFINLMACSAVLITDSGGLQEEAPSFGVPVLVTRKHTERPLVVSEGKAFLVSDDKKKIRESFEKIKEGWDYNDKSNPYGDGKSASRVVKILEERFL